MRHDVSESFITFVNICTHVFLTVAGVICPQFGNKDSAKNRFSEEKENKLSFLSVRFLFKSKTKQNKSPKTFIFFVEMQPILSKDSAKNRFSKEKENKLSFLRFNLLIFNL